MESRGRRYEEEEEDLPLPRGRAVEEDDDLPPPRGRAVEEEEEPEREDGERDNEDDDRKDYKDERRVEKDDRDDRRVEREERGRGEVRGREMEREEPPPRSRERTRSPEPRREDPEEIRNPGNNLYISGLSSRTTMRDLEEHFGKEGRVEDCRLVADPRTKESRGFAFIMMASADDAARCIKYLDRSVLQGRMITVQLARRSRPRTPTPGRFLGVRPMINGPPPRGEPYGADRRGYDRGGGYGGGSGGYDRGYDRGAPDRGGGGYDRGYERDPYPPVRRSSPDYAPYRRDRGDFRDYR